MYYDVELECTTIFSHYIQNCFSITFLRDKIYLEKYCCEKLCVDSCCSDWIGKIYIFHLYKEFPMVSSVRFRYQSLSEIITFITLRGLQQLFYRQRKIILSRIDWFSLSRVCFEQRTSKAEKINLFSWKGFGVNNGSIWKSNYPFITLSNEKKERRNLPLANISGQLTLIGRLSERWQSQRDPEKISTLG